MRIIRSIPLCALSALLIACSGGSSTDPIVKKRSVYRPNSAYADVLLSCTTFKTIEESCYLSELPFIGNGLKVPTIDEVMDRVIVQEPWMGERFEQVLSRAPEDVLWLLSSVTHIELAGDKPGDFYRTWAGGIKFSAQPLWLSEEERLTLDFSDVADNRFATHLNFRHPWSNNHQGDAYDEFNRSTATRRWNGERDFDRIFLSFMDGLYHELSHAAVYVNPIRLVDIDSSRRVHEVTYPVQGPDIRISLRNLYPLKLDRMRVLSDSYYAASSLPDALKGIGTDEVVQAFSEDGAMELYSYFSDSEDVATLFQATMMKYHYGASKTVGFANKPTGRVTCESVILKWGVHDRLANPVVAQRAQHVANAILSGHTNFTAFFSNQSTTEQPIEANTPWCDVRDGA